MSTLSKAVARSGALDEEMLRELAHWKLPIALPEDEPFASPAEATEAIDEALRGEDQVEIRATDLDLLPQFRRTQRRTKLHLIAGDEKETVEIPVGLTLQNEYILPWHHASLTDVLTNGSTYLQDGRRRVYFSDARACYYGEKQTFVVCKAAPEDHRGDKD